MHRDSKICKLQERKTPRSLNSVTDPSSPSIPPPILPQRPSYERSQGHNVELVNNDNVRYDLRAVMNQYPSHLIPSNLPNMAPSGISNGRLTYYHNSNYNDQRVSRVNEIQNLLNVQTAAASMAPGIQNLLNEQAAASMAPGIQNLLNLQATAAATMTSEIQNLLNVQATAAAAASMKPSTRNLPVKPSHSHSIVALNRGRQHAMDSQPRHLRQEMDWQASQMRLLNHHIQGQDQTLRLLRTMLLDK